jgi:transcriptional regulator with XRE-family HTH domain
MVTMRKNIPSYIAKNLLFLRTSKGLTLEDMAKVLELQGGKTSYYVYEQGKVIPDIFKLMKLASFFDVSIEEIVNTDIELTPVKKNLSTPLYEVEKVPIMAKAGYAIGFADPEWIGTSLQKVKIPYKPYGIARVFELDGDSMLPEYEDGCSVVAIKVSPTDIKDLKTYIVVTANGIQCKDIRVGEDVIYLVSKNITHAPKHISKSEVMELWEVWKKIKPGETWESPGLEN